MASEWAFTIFVSTDWMDGGDCGIAQARRANVQPIVTNGAKYMGSFTGLIPGIY